jgi:anthranilate/para-aminobenzoate synthase component II
VVAIDHNDSYVWNLVDLVAAVTGTVPDVVQHDAMTAAEVLAYDHVVLFPGPAHGDVAAVCHDGTGLFAGIPSPYRAVRYHSLAATRVPAELVVTAECRDAERGSVVVGVRHRHLPLHGVQFHPESVFSEHRVRLVENFLRNTR